MNSGESTAGCSSNGRENGAALLDPERPHKKARFPWQIKGNHHLKKQANEPTVSSNVTPEKSETVTAPPAAERFLRTEPFPRRTSLEHMGPGPSNTEVLPANVNSLGPTDIPNNTDPPIPLETVISLAETMLLSSGLKVPKTPTQDLPGPSKRYYSPAREARRRKRQEDMCISRWQATQTVKGCFDNTINRVLESWMNTPAQADQRLLAIDMARVMNDDLNSNDENVENEGILMAINAHGLQSMGNPIIEPSLPAMTKSPYQYDTDSSICSDDFKILTDREGSPWPLDDSTNHSEEPANYEPWRPVHEILNTNPTEPLPAPTEDYEYEFMNTAVIQAIKSKGLMAAGTDFG